MEQFIDQSPRLLFERLERVEKQNRRLRFTMIIVLLLIGTLTVMGQKRAASPIEAESFIVNDKKGKVRIRIAMTQDDPQVTLYDADGGITSLSSRSLMFIDSQLNVKLWLSSGVKGTSLSMAGHPQTQAHLAASDDGPMLELKDKEGFSATVGATKLDAPRTGEKSTTSAASMILFGKDSRVVWRAP